MKKIMTIALATVMVIGCSFSAWAGTVPDNPAETTVPEIAAGDSMDHNSGTVTTNSGTVTTNSGTVTTNSGTVTTNIGTVETNNGRNFSFISQLAGQNNSPPGHQLMVIRRAFLQPFSVILQGLRSGGALVQRCT